MRHATATLIITHYNQLHYLTNLLDYCKANHWFGVEKTIVIDDASLSQVQIDELKLEYSEVSFYRNSNNQGPSFSRNFAVSKTSSTYIQFLDADDWIHPLKIQQQLAYASQNSFPTFVCSQWARVTSSSTYSAPSIMKTYVPIIEEPHMLNIMQHFFPLMSGLIFREAFLNINGFNNNMRLIEDVNLAIRLFFNSGKFEVMTSDHPLFFYRVSDGLSLSKSNDLEFNRSILANYKLCFNMLEKQHHTTEIKSQRMKSFAVLWHIYLEAIRLNSTSLVDEVIVELKKTPSTKDLYRKHGKKFLLSQLVGYKMMYKLLTIL